MALFNNPDRLGVFATFVSLLASILAVIAAVGILQRIEAGEEPEDDEIIVIGSQSVRDNEIIILKQKIDALEKHIEKINAYLRSSL